MQIQLDDPNALSSSQTALATGCFTSYTEFHHAIGHLQVPKPERIYKDGADVPHRPKDFHCETCELSKSVYRRPVPSAPTIAHPPKPFEVIHSDLSGKFSRASLGGARYFISFICQATRHSWVRFLKHKSEAAQAIRDFIAYINTQFGRDITPANIMLIKRFKTDNGGEYIAAAKDLKQLGIVHDMVPPYHHELNGLPERWNRAVMDISRAMIDTDNLLFLWAEAVQTANFLKNITPHSALGITPHEALFGTKPTIKHLHPFGTKVYVHIPSEARAAGSKLLHRAEEGLFVGYGRNTKTSRVYVPSRHVILESRNVRFQPFSVAHARPFFQLLAENDILPSEPALGLNNSRPIKARAPSGDTTTPKADTNRDTSLQPPPLSAPLEDPSRASRTASDQPSTIRSTPSRIVTTRSGRVSKPSQKKRESETASAATAPPLDDDLAHTFCYISKTDIDDEIPRTYAKATSETNAPLWLPPIHREVQAHIDNGTWEVEHNPPANAKLVGTRWVFDIKRDESGKVVKRKARLVAQGFSQRPGIDFDDTYSPVVRYDSLRFIILIALTRGWDMRQVDFDAAYLNSELSHVIYARAPLGVPTDGASVIRIKRALYGLKQSGREWYGMLSRWLKEQDFIQATFDPCVFTSSDLILGVYVDDVLMAGTTLAISTMITRTSARFKFRDMGKPKLLLGLEIEDSQPYGTRLIQLHQRTYIAAILRRYGMSECNGRLTPLDPNSFPPRSPADEPIELERQKTFQSIVGSINFLAIVSRPDLSYTVSMLGSYNSNPSELHLKMAYQTLRYIQATRDLSICMVSTSIPRQQMTQPATAIQLVMYSDASFGSDPDNSKSFSGYILKINGCTVSWSSKRQSCVAKSTCEAEYMAASHAASHLVWARQAISELTSSSLVSLAVGAHLMVDNEPAIALTKDQRTSNRSKHINVHYHFVRERFADGEYSLSHVSSAENLADICTKSLARPTLVLLRDQIFDYGCAASGVNKQLRHHLGD
ncbi:hypothetical protein PZA11_001115 [Diplocarpon coronariae]